MHITSIFEKMTLCLEYIKQHTVYMNMSLQSPSLRRLIVKYVRYVSPFEATKEIVNLYDVCCFSLQAILSSEPFFERTVGSKND